MVKKQCSGMALRYMLITHNPIIYLDPSFRRYAPACVLRQIKHKFHKTHFSDISFVFHFHKKLFF